MYVLPIRTYSRIWSFNHLENFEKYPHGVVEECLVLGMTNYDVEVVAELLHRFQLVLIFRLKYGVDILIIATLPFLIISVKYYTNIEKTWGNSQLKIEL